MKKIAILISGNDCDNINGHKIAKGYSFKYVVDIIRKQFEDNYDVSYYVVLSKQFDLNIFDNKLKAFSIKIDKEIKQHDTHKFNYQFLRRTYFIDMIKDTNYDFYIYLRNDRILTPNGFGVWDRNVPLNKTAGWRKINGNKKNMNPIDKDYFLKPLKFIDTFDLSKLYIIRYGFNNDLKNDSSIWDGFALGNKENIIKYIEFNYNKFIKNHDIRDWSNNKRQFPPCEKSIKKYLDIQNIELCDVNNILEFPKPVDDKLNLLTHNGFT